MKIIACLLFLSACGSGRVIVEPCTYADLITSGVCVLTNGYDIDPEMIDFAIIITNVEMNIALYREDDHQATYSDLGVSIEYVEPKHQKLSMGDDNYARGITRDRELIVNYIDNIPTIQCIEHYYVFSHELMHVISRYLLEVTPDENYTHDVPYVFLQWAFDNDEPLISTAEFHTYISIMRECERRFGEID